MKENEVILRFFHILLIENNMNNIFNLSPSVNTMVNLITFLVLIPRTHNDYLLKSK